MRFSGFFVDWSLTGVCFVVISTIIFLVTLLFSVAFYVLAERKILGSLQRRRGPTAVGF